MATMAMMTTMVVTMAMMTTMDVTVATMATMAAMESSALSRDQEWGLCEGR